MNLTVHTTEAQKNFYPTPLDVGQKLLDGLDVWRIKTVLEPSAGSGNLLLAFGYKMLDEYYKMIGEHRGFGSPSFPKIKFDMIEIDPALRGIISDTFISPANSYWYQLRELEQSNCEENQDQIQYLKMMDSLTTNCSFSVVHEDFLVFETFTKYDLIIMNPPFDKGDAHLLHAIQLQSRYGGQIRCILNAETLRNPCTHQREHLARKLADLNAEVSFIENAFSDAERKTNVSIALVKIAIPDVRPESIFYQGFQKAEAAKEVDRDPTDLTAADTIEAILAQYRVEVNSGIALINEYLAMKPYILHSINKESIYNRPILNLSIDEKDPSINRYVQAVRLKYWSAIFHNKSVFGMLTQNLSNELYSQISEMGDYEFTLYNIDLLIKKMNAKLAAGIEETILAHFETLSGKYHWRDDPDCANIHYYSGWATNKAHKINKKVIIPCSGIFQDSWRRDYISEHTAYSILSDLEKTFNYLDGKMTEPVDLEQALKLANLNRSAKNIQCKFFTVTFYKKGTAHITFTNQRLLDRFNIYCGQKKNWLPPRYGNVHYDDMDSAEKAVIDSFHGNAEPESGKKEYEEVVNNARYYLAPPAGDATLPPLLQN